MKMTQAMVETIQEAVEANYNGPILAMLEQVKELMEVADTTAYKRRKARTFVDYGGLYAEPLHAIKELVREVKRQPVPPCVIGNVFGIYHNLDSLVAACR